MRETNREFKNRSEAGRFLGTELKPLSIENPVILAIARGGVIVGYEVAKLLNCDFEVVVSRKLGYPDQPEAAFGSIAEDGSLYMNPWIRKKLSDEVIKSVIRREENEIHRRIMVYRNGRSLPVLNDRNVIIVDDGIATGSTLFVTIELCKKQFVNTVVVAAPVCGADLLRIIDNKVDQSVVLTVPEEFYAVSQVYEEFLPVSDSDVKRVMEKWANRHQPSNSMSQIAH